MGYSNQQLEAFIRKLAAKVQHTEGLLRQVTDKYEEFVRACEDQPRSITQEIDSIPGRRIFYTLNARQAFTIAQNGVRGAGMNYLISQDGPFIATHYPCAAWLPSAPSNATNFGAWRPVATWPLPDQVLDTDLIDLSYEVHDSGSQRNFQNEPTGPIWSRPDNLIPLPVPTLFAPNSVIQVTPIYERISFNATQGQEATTGGTLWIGIPGYKIVNL